MKALLLLFGHELLQQLMRTDTGQRKGHFQNQCSKPVASRDKKVNMAAGDFGDALVLCVENTVKDRIMDYGASFHATYCIEEIGINMLASKGNVPDVQKKSMALHLLHQSEDPATMILLSKTAAGVTIETPLQFGVAKRLSQTFRAKSMGLRAEARRCKGAQMKCDTAFRIKRVARLSEAEILHLLTRFIEPSGSSNTSEGSENSESFEDSRRSDEEYSEDGASFMEGVFETPHITSRKEGITKIVDVPGLKKHQDGSKMYKARLVVKGSFCVGALNDTSTQHKSEGFQLAGQKENLECRLKEILYGLIQASRLWYLKFDSSMQKDKVDDILVAGSDMAEFNKPKCNVAIRFE
ncbi:hypothetical protein Tco_0318315 [Tanacetum coccineum]